MNWRGECILEPSYHTLMGEILVRAMDRRAQCGTARGESGGILAAFSEEGSNDLVKGSIRTVVKWYSITSECIRGPTWGAELLGVNSGLA